MALLSLWSISVLSLSTVNDSIGTLSLHIWAFEVHCTCLWFLYAHAILVHEEGHHSFYHNHEDECDIIIGINFFTFHWKLKLNNKQASICICPLCELMIHRPYLSCQKQKWETIIVISVTNNF
jgi:hypothetical protein